jgi:uncharacterized protein Yka (UPF0111/DUF47 family)
MTTLYDINKKYLEALEFLTDPENEMDAQTIADTMEGMEGELTDKILNTARYVLHIEHQADGISDAIKRMSARAKALENHADRMRDYIRDNMQDAGLKKIPSHDVIVSLAKLPASVQIDDESLIPINFWMVKEVRSLNKTAIKDAGGCAGARVESKGNRVSIK